jgi:cysteinyl-tRNA synthetase
VPPEFAHALDADLAVPQALAVVHAGVRDGNLALSAGDKDAVTKHLAELRAMLGVLGLDPFDPHWGGTGAGADARLRSAVDTLVAVALEQREAARGRKDFATADAIRARLAAAGIRIEDTPSGPRWELEQ